MKKQKRIRKSDTSGKIYKMCNSKKRFKNEYEAYKNLKSLSKNRPNDAMGVSPYKCPFCEGWHLGHNQRYVARAGKTQGKIGA